MKCIFWNKCCSVRKYIFVSIIVVMFIGENDRRWGSDYWSIIFCCNNAGILALRLASFSLFFIIPIHGLGVSFICKEIGFVIMSWLLWRIVFIWKEEN